MTKNVGQTDRALRTLIGALVIIIGVFAGSWWGLLGLIPLVTGTIGWCPVYGVFKFSTVRAAA